MCHHCKSQKCHPDKKEGGCSSKAINQCHFNKYGGVYVIDKPGSYHLAKDVKGTLSIKSNNVCLNLCCHTIDANGAANAIRIGELVQVSQTLGKKSVKLLREAKKEPKSFNAVKRDTPEMIHRTVKASNAVVGELHHIRIFNGTVSGATSDAIFANEISDLEISDLTSLQNLNGIRVLNSNAVKIQDVDFSGKQIGDNALLVENTDNLFLEKLSVAGYTATQGSLVEIIDCGGVLAEDVYINGNEKTVGGTGALFYVGQSVRVDFKNVHVDQNANNFSGEDYRFHALHVDGVTDGTFSYCSTSDNVDLLGAGDFSGTLQFTRIEDSFNIQLKGYQANSNKAEELISSFASVLLVDCVNVSSDSVQTNSNVANLKSGFFDYFLGLWALGVDGFSIRNSQANSNRLLDSELSRAGPLLIAGIRINSLATVVENVQASFNVVDDQSFLCLLWGILVSAPEGLAVNDTDTSFNTNNGAGVAYGLATHFGQLNANRCTSTHNSNYGISLGFREDPGASVVDNVLIDCVCKNNGTKSVADDAAGIILQPVSEGVQNTIIRNCEVSATGNSSTSSSGGIVAKGSNDLVVENCLITKTSAEGDADGLLLQDVSNAVISNCQSLSNNNRGFASLGESTNISFIENVSSNNDKGFELSADTTFSLVRDNVAINNLSLGFEQDASGIFNTSYIRNQAQNAGGLPTTSNFGGASLTSKINLQELSWSNGDYTIVNGNVSPLTNVSSVA